MEEGVYDRSGDVVRLRSLSDFKVEILKRQLDVQLWILGNRLAFKV